MFVHSVCDHSCRHLNVNLFTTLEGIQAEGPSWRQVEELGGRGSREGRRGAERGGGDRDGGEEEGQGKIRISQGAEGALGI